ncbi:MAG: prolyl oligopeptidase family serine peptidase, partial [Steroidobacteraceae bacterium]
TLAVLEHDQRYSALYADALTIAQAQDRIPEPRFLGAEVFNFWQDAQHVRGIWRKTSLADYRNPAPTWSTVLDLDAQAREQNANWFWKGADCLRPAERRCLISLSDGGEDAVSVREFDLGVDQYVPSGFELPRSKQSAAWVDQDQLLIARDWGPGTMTASGYPFVVKRLARGAPLAAAQEVFRGTPADVEVDVTSLIDGAGRRAVLILRAVSFFETQTYLLGSSGPQRLNLPLKSEVVDLLDGRLLIKLNQSWNIARHRFPEGALIWIDLDAARADPKHLQPRLIFAPGARQSLGSTGTTHSHLLLSLYDNVKGRTFIYTPMRQGSWSHRALTLPDDASIGIVDADAHSDRAFLSVAGFLMPSSLWLTDAGSGELAEVKSLPPKFDAAPFVVEQWQVTSKDGTRIPYFIVHRKDMILNGQNPTILNAYGGFQISNTPFYSAVIGKLWLERGGVFVLANIRGGGEFGPAWHEAGLKTHRQRIYDDFAAVAEDLIARKVTSPRRLGIEGGSNGGLLMGVEFTQHPLLWNAVDMQVPLLDMLRFEKIAAGSSWVGEYGSVANSKERAFLASISPYNNLRPDVHYPEPFIWTTTKDDRVGPQHARKFAAKLSAMGVPYLFYEVIEGGHAAGASLQEKAHTAALEMTYFSSRLMN